MSISGFVLMREDGKFVQERGKDHSYGNILTAEVFHSKEDADSNRLYREHVVALNDALRGIAR